ncbi:MAG: hypothetical protein WA603_19180 [Candidatus Acidiferrales bacterium]
MEQSVVDDSSASGVSWAAVIAGASVAAALSLILLALGTGIGFSAMSPWANAGASATAISAGAIIWFVMMEIISSSMGGYLAGRLRVKWSRVHTHEVYFRDTAHGFLVWAVGVVITAAFLASAAAAVAGGAARGRAMMAESSSGAEMARENAGPSAYFVDILLRPSAISATDDSAAMRGEVALIFANAIRQGSLPPGDKTFLGRVVAARTGVSEPEAERRVEEVFAQAREAADKARKAVAHTMYWTFLALLVGAFCASWAATIGGRQRDRVVAV